MSVDRARESADISGILARKDENARKYPVRVLVELTEEQGRFLAKHQWEAGRRHGMAAELRLWVDGQMRLEARLNREMSEEEEIECFGKPLDEYLDDKYAKEEE